MNDILDILEILESAATEIRSLRSSVANYKLTTESIAIRVALHQLMHGPVEYRNSFDVHWDRMNELIDSRRLVLNNCAEATLDGKFLTPQVLAESK